MRRSRWGEVGKARGFAVVLEVVEALGAEHGDEALLRGVPLWSHGLGGECVGLDEDEAVSELLDGAGREGQGRSPNIRTKGGPKKLRQ